MTEAAISLYGDQGNLTNIKGFSRNLFQLFINETDCKNTTLKGYITYIRAFSKWMNENGISCPSWEDIKAYKAYLESSALSTGTKAQYLRAVKHFFNWAAARGLYPNIAADIKPDKVRNEYHKKDALQRDAVPLIAGTIDTNTIQGKRLYAMYLLCITCGLRTVELSRANIEDIHTVAGRTYLYVQGKGRDDKDAPVLLVPDVLEAIEAYLACRKDAHNGKMPLFTSTSNRTNDHGEKRIAPTTISTMLKGMLKNAGYDSKRLTAHSLRHTSGTGAYNATHSIYLTQQHARHADPKTTEIYVHAEDRQSRNTEQQVYDYYFNADAAQDAEKEAIQIIKQLPPDKLSAALEMMKKML